MNLLGSMLSLKKLIKPGFILMIPVFLGCETSEDPGIDYELDSNASVKFVEFILPAENIYIDSLRTDGENKLLVGNYTDPIAGTVSTEGYFQFFYESGPLPRPLITEANPIPTDSLTLDSAFLILEGNTSLSTGALGLQEFDVFTLQDSLISSAVYLSSLELVKEQQIGSFSKEIQVQEQSLFQTRLSNDFSSSLFSQLGEISQDPSRLAASEVFKSLGLSPRSTSEVLTEFSLDSDSSRIVLYTSPRNPNTKDTTYITTLSLSGKNFSKIDRSSATYGMQEDQATFSFSNGETVIDPLYGLSTTFEITQLNSFFNSNENIIINSAILALSFKEDVSRDYLTRFYSFFNKENGFFAPAVVSNSFSNLIMNDNAYLNGQNNPSISQINSNNEQLDVNATLFFQTLYNNYNEFGDLVFRNQSGQGTFPLTEIVLISQSDVTLQRTIFQKDGIKLRLYYTEVN